MVVEGTGLKREEGKMKSRNGLKEYSPGHDRGEGRQGRMRGAKGEEDGGERGQRKRGKGCRREGCAKWVLKEKELRERRMCCGSKGVSFEQ